MANICGRQAVSMDQSGMDGRLFVKYIQAQANIMQTDSYRPRTLSPGFGDCSQRSFSCSHKGLESQNSLFKVEIQARISNMFIYGISYLINQIRTKNNSKITKLDRVGCKID